MSELEQLRAQVAAIEADAETLRRTVLSMAEDIVRMKRVCGRKHPPKMGSPTRDWTVGTETRHSDGVRCVLLNDGDWAVLAEWDDTSADPEPRPSDGPDYHAEHAAWLARQRP